MTGYAVVCTATGRRMPIFKSDYNGCVSTVVLARDYVERARDVWAEVVPGQEFKVRPIQIGGRRK